MVNLTPETKKKLLNLGRYAFDNPGYDISPKELLEKLIKSSYEVLTEIIGERNCPGCITYTNKSPELISWAIGLICIRYNLYLLQKKKIDGHCKTHKLPCQKGGIFHDELFNEVKKSFYELVTDDYEKEIKKA